MESKHTRSIEVSESGEPQLAGTPLRVIDITQRAYGEGMLSAAEMGTPPVGREAVEAAISYCADRGCDLDKAWCSGCRLATEARGIASLDDYCSRFASLRFADSGLIVTGGGTGTVTVPSLDALSRSWMGQEVFYLARRVHRRLHKERDPRPKKMAGAEGQDGPVIILVEPQMADNIGMVARAMANFGLEALRVVAPRDGWPNERAHAAASGASFVIDAVEAYPTTAESIGDLHWVAATTARQRDLNKPVMTPEQLAVELLRRSDAGQRVGILFGAERQGLQNDDIALADAVVMAPVNPRFASLNLAQAVLLIGYEWMRLTGRGTLGRVTTYEQPLEPGLRLRGSTLASKAELHGFFEHLERELDEAGFLKPPEKRATMIRNIRSMFERMGATEQEIRTLRGIVASLTYAHRRRRDQS
jgi:tRNA/rRNA methyltransferase